MDYSQAKTALSRHKPASWLRARLHLPTICRDCGQSWACVTVAKARGVIERFRTDRGPSEWYEGRN